MGFYEGFEKRAIDPVSASALSAATAIPAITGIAGTVGAAYQRHKFEKQLQKINRQQARANVGLLGMGLLGGAALTGKNGKVLKKKIQKLMHPKEDKNK